uniref:Uncharacterized protein n=1 Tax=Romanomermis culicivorax TaxID=13658 RepID=A0A915IAG8_ROMCU
MPPVDGCRNGRYNGVFYVDDYPRYCIINDLSANNGKCISIEALHTAIRDRLAAKPFVYNQTVDNTIEYKRYIVKCKHKYSRTQLMNTPSGPK